MFTVRIPLRVVILLNFKAKYVPQKSNFQYLVFARYEKNQNLVNKSSVNFFNNNMHCALHNSTTEHWSAKYARKNRELRKVSY